MKPRGYWLVWENLENELKLIIEKLGRFPTFCEVRNLISGGTACTAIGRFGGIAEVAKRMGYQESSINLVKDYTEDKIINMLKDIVKEIGHFPTQQELVKLGYNGLSHAVYKYQKNLHYYSDLLGFDPHERPKKYWHSLDNLLNEIRPFIKNGKIPNQDFLVYNIGSVFRHGIEFHGGMSKIAELLNCEISFRHTTSDGHIVKSKNEYIIDEFLFSRGIPHEVDGMIDKSSEKYRYDFKIGDIYVEVWGFSKDNNSSRGIYYNNIRKLKEQFYKDRNLTLVSIEEKIFKNKFKHSEKEIEKDLSDLFSSHDILKL
jgi:hypothetical protein